MAPNQVEEKFRPKSNDPCWEFAWQPDKNKASEVRCEFCPRLVTGGINRLKRHIAGIKGDVARCPNPSAEAKKMCLESLENIQKKKEEMAMTAQKERDEVDIHGEPVDPDVLEIGSKRPRTFGPIDKFSLKLDAKTAAALKDGSLKQDGIKDSFGKKERAKVNAFVAKWVYKCGISFNALADPSFMQLCEAIGQYGPHYKPPTPYELSEPLLQEQVNETEKALQEHKDTWNKTGCTVMTDAWTDRRGRSIMNLCVNCELGTCFRKCIDASADSHTAEYICGVVDGFIEDVGEDNVVQVVTDNAAANLAAAKLLMVKRPRIYWTSCAAHCIDLMLEKISKNKSISAALVMAKELTIFIYAHHRTLSLMRKFTNDKDIVRPGATRFATSFLTMSSLLDKKNKIRMLLTSDEYKSLSISKSVKGRKATTTVVRESFWKQVTLTVKVFEPLYRLLRVVDGEQKPSMGYVYGGLLDAKESIKKLLKKEPKYKPYVAAIDFYMNGKLDNPLHLMAYYLNPYYFYRDCSKIEVDEKIMDGILSCIERFFPDPSTQDHIAKVEMRAYKIAAGQFGRPQAIRQRESNDKDFNPAHWWSIYGSAAPHLQSIASKVLNLTSSSSGCERNWSSFEWVHSKKRNRFLVKRMNKVVFVQFNAKLFDRKKEKVKNPILAKEMRKAAEWLVADHDEQEEFTSSGLSWGLVDETVVEEALQPIKITKSTPTVQSSSAAVDALNAIELVSSDDGDDKEEEEEEEEDEEEEQDLGLPDDDVGNIDMGE